MSRTNLRTLCIVVPVRNTGAFLEEALASLAAQRGATLDRWQVEAIIVDDASDDPATLGILARLPQRLGAVTTRLLRRDRSTGISAARNAAIASSEAAWITFLDSDDLLLEGALECRLQAVEAHPDIRFFSADVHYWYEDRGEPRPGALRYRDTALVSALRRDQPGQAALRIERPFERFFESVPVHTNTALIARSALDEAGAFDERLRRCEDTDLWYRLARLGPVGYVDAPVAIYRRHSQGITRTPEDEGVYMLRLFDKLAADRTLAPSDQALVLVRRHEILLNSCHYQSARGDAVASWRHLMQALRLRPLSARNLRYLTQPLKAMLRRANVRDAPH